MAISPLYQLQMLTDFERSQSDIPNEAHSEQSPQPALTESHGYIWKAPQRGFWGQVRAFFAARRDSGLVPRRVFDSRKDLCQNSHV